MLIFVCYVMVLLPFLPCTEFLKHYKEKKGQSCKQLIKTFVICPFWFNKEGGKHKQTNKKTHTIFFQKKKIKNRLIFLLRSLRLYFFQHRKIVFHLKIWYIPMLQETNKWCNSCSWTNHHKRDRRV